jgi:lipopolysaccharide transport system ATP-binding protein
MNQPAVIVHQLGKQFQQFHSNRPRTIMEAAVSGWRRLKPTNQFWALQDISFTVMPGQMLGILGHNGAGKSTLLQLIGGVGRPSCGWVKVHGRIGALLDLGASFHADLTGRENVFVSAIAAGLTRREVNRRFGAIVEFAELEKFIDSPLRTYSTGMQMRLAFAIAVHTVPDVLLVDEHLSVGDIAFQTKCLDRIAQLKANGCAIVLISQSAKQICELCDQALWLDRGKIAALGDPHVVAENYVNRMDAKSLPKPTQNYSREVAINQVQLLDATDQPVVDLGSGEPLMIAIHHYTEQRSLNIIISVSISNEVGQIYFNTHTATAGLSLPLEPGDGTIRLHLSRLDLSGGNYFVNVGIFSSDWSKTYDYHWHQYPFQIRSTPSEDSILYPPCRWEILNQSTILPGSPTLQQNLKQLNRESILTWDNYRTVDYP